MDLKVGTIVAYPPHGVGRVAKREKKVVLGVEEEIVVIELGNELSVTLPLARAQEQLRPPATEADLKKVQKALRESSVVSDEIWSKRVQQAQEKLRSGDPLELAEIVRDGVRREQGKRPPGRRRSSRRASGAPPEGPRAPFRRDRRHPRRRPGRRRRLDRRAARRREVAPRPGSRAAANSVSTARRRAPLRAAASRGVDAPRRCNLIPPDANCSTWPMRQRPG